jgi:hypothetical protein
MKLCADCLLRSSRRGICHGMPAKTIAFCRAFGFSVTRRCACPLADQAEDREGTPANRLC